jgi:hypothetical protein
MANESFWKRLREIGIGLVVDQLKVWLLPILGAAAGLVIAYMRQVPLEMYFVFIVGGFALVSVGLNNFSTWWFNNNARNRLSPADPFIRLKVDKNVNPPIVQFVQFGFALKNIARFPIDFEVVSLSTRIDNLVNPNPTYHSRLVNVSAGSTGFYHDDWIAVGNHRPNGSAAIGDVKVTIKYGRPTALRYIMTLHYMVTIYADANGLISERATFMMLPPDE